MRKLPSRKENLWGKEHDVEPMLLDAIRGDGKQIVYFGYTEHRPYFYVVRIDSNDPTDGDPWYDEVHPWIINQIFEEMTEFMTEDLYDEWQENGFVVDHPHFPIPPLEIPCGSYWGPYEPIAGDMEVIDA